MSTVAQKEESFEPKYAKERNVFQALLVWS